MNKINWYDSESSCYLNNVDSYVVNEVADVSSEGEDVIVLVNSLWVRVIPFGNCIIIPI